MRHVSSSDSSSETKRSTGRGFGSFATKAFVATATASTSFAAYYCATTLLLGSVVAAHGDSGVDADDNKSGYNAETKKNVKFGVEYSGFDSYPGIHLDDGTGVATKEVKAASAKVVSKALDAAGLDESGILKGATNGASDPTIHHNHAHRHGLGTCPVYGCPFLPLDVHYNEDLKSRLESMRKELTTSADDSKSAEKDENHLISSTGAEHAATLTLIGYKGGALESQINQDRALVLSPYLYHNINSSSNGDAAKPVTRLLGAFDGHAKYGEKVSEYVVKTLAALLGSKLAEYDAKNLEAEADQTQKDHDIGKILHETFKELDATAPAHPSGGCTASVVLQLGTRIYVANAGDSYSFIAVHINDPTQSTSASDDAKGKTHIIFDTREDKPHLSTERDRVEHMGGTVYLPNGFLDHGKGTTRVLYQDPTTGSTSGLAMSRSIGDWDAGEVGVIPDPLIDILDVNDIKARVLETLNEECKAGAEQVEIDPASGDAVQSSQCVEYTEQDIKIFAVSGTDGLFDYLPGQTVANHVAKGLYDTAGSGDAESKGKTHPLLVCEDLIYAAAQGWQEDKGGRYRDDIAIAIADLEIETAQ
ncbi:hypothetical protein ACHAXT_010343 [Thalassiosira profunda]